MSFVLDQMPSLQELEQHDREPLIVTYLQEQVAKIAAIAASEIELEQSLVYFGFDSLMAVELRNQLLTDLEVDISLLAILEDASVASLSSLINQQIETGIVLPQPDRSADLGTSADDRTRYPLSQGQWGLWFLHQLTPDSAAYNLAFTARIRSFLNLEALQKSVQALIHRHPTLRTTYGQKTGNPFQEIHATQPLQFEQIDASDWDEPTLRQQAIAAYQRPFNLETGPVLRVTVLTQSPQNHVLLLVIHHIAVDGVSFGILLDELQVLYQANSIGQSITLPLLAPAYIEFVQWQQELINGPIGESLWGYWEQQLRDVPTLHLPYERSRPATQPEQGASYNFELSAALTARLRSLSKATGASLYVTLLTAFQVLLYRYTGQEDVVVGTPASGRQESRFAQTVGFFVNMIALRTHLAGNPPFVELLAQVRSTVLAAIEHQAYPAPLLIERLGLNRDLRQPGLFRAAFNLLNLSKLASDFELSVSNHLETQVQWGDLCLEAFEIPQQEGQNDLVFDVMETPDRLIGILRYSTDLFDETVIQRFAAHFKTLLTSVVANPQQPIACLSILSPAEQQQQQWATPTATYPTHLCAHQLIEAQVARTPEAIALVCGDRSLTYEQLNRQANQLAHELQTQGVTTESRVGICLARSPDLIVAVLAVLKAGGAYVPLDPNYPAARLQAMLTDADAALLLTHSAWSGLFAEFTGATVCLDKAELTGFATAAVTNPVSSVTPANLAYVVYTSGSTGKAKGVMIEHRSLVNAYFAWAAAYDLTTCTSHLQMASFSFDVFAGDLIRALAAGAKLVLCPTEYLLEPALLYLLMQETAIDFAEFGPAVVRQLIQYLQHTDQRLDWMRVLIVGSDAFYLPEYQQLKALCGPARVINSYGVSEATIDSSFFEADDLCITSDSMVPIGRPFANTALHVLNEYFQPVPIGVAGELYIGGAGLARGYVQAELTRARFLEVEPFGRLYQTGDRVRYLADGNLEYLGRNDNQVKLRGFRIELGEIEAILTHAPNIWQSIVTVRADALGIQSLVAYLVPQWGQEIAIADLRTFLKQKLPDPMLPGAFVVLESLPLTPNGKIDRQALPTPEFFQRDVVAGFVAPRTAIERQLAQIWGDLLQLDRVGVEDNFFELGGHSLLATQVITQIRAALQVDLPLRVLLAAPTIAHLAELIESSYHQRLAVTAAIGVCDRPSEVPLSFGQESLWFLNQLEDIGATYNMPLPLRLTGDLNVTVLEQSLNALIQRHEILRTRCVMGASRPMQVILPDVQFNLPVVDLRSLPDGEQAVQQLIAREVETPFDLAGDRLWRVSLLHLAATDHVLLLTVHHIVADGWSVSVLVSELAAFYTAFLTHQPVTLEPRSLQYADFAIWQQQYLQGEVLELLLAHWQRTLHNAPPVLSLPTDSPRPAVQSFRGRSVAFELAPSLTAALKTLSQQAQVTQFMTLLAAFKILLRGYTGQEDIVVGAPVANRDRPELAELIGYFVNVLVLRTDLSGNPSFREVLARVYQGAIAAYSYQDLPFEKLVEVMQPERSLSHSPLFQVMFVLQNVPMPEVTLPNLTLQGMDVEITTSKFDLTLAFRETATGFTGFVEYNTDLFQSETIDRLIQHYQILLEQIVVNPDLTLSEFSLLTPIEQQQFSQWNATQANYPTDRCIHQIFEAQVEKSPAAIAVVYQAKSLTYRQLNDRANQLAHALQARGIGPEVRVGLCLERSLDLIVAVLAVWKAGGVFVPLDPNYPAERLALMVTDAQVKLVLTQSQLTAKLLISATKIICLEQEQAAIAQHSKSNPISHTTPENLVYIVYTSGSTGKAKGVMIEHRSVVNAYFAWNNAYNLSMLDSHLQVANFAFDVFVGDLVRSLCAGSKLVLCPADHLLDPGLLYQLMQNQKITAAEFSPAILRLFMQYLQHRGQRLDFMQLLVVGSDTFYRPEYQQLKALCSAATRVIHSYGVTEATIDSSYFESDARELTGDGMVPIGRPLANTQLHVLDQDLQPVPVGIVGELYIGGAGLGRGYLNRPELTAERFLPSPFSPDARLYKTGDRARYLTDGTVELIGRCDGQVKLRGFRIETGEIEAVLIQHPAVRSTVVVLRSLPHGESCLVAYLVTSEARSTALIADCRDFLKAHLPGYMVPAQFVFLEKLPLTTNGKIDRRSLPAPEMTPVEETFVAPTTAIETTLAAIWTEILQQPQIGIHNNFFDLGGHSLLATSLVFRMRQAFEIQISLRQLFETPTIAQLSQFIESQFTQTIQAIERPSLLPRNQPPEQPVPLSLSQQYIWQMQQGDRTGSGLNSSIALQFRGELSSEVLNRSLNEIVCRHEILRTVFTIVDGQPMQRVLPTLTVNAIEIDLQTLPVDQRQSVAVQQGMAIGQQPFDLARAPLLRVAILRFTPTKQWLLLTLHHIITDGWSFGLLTQELDSFMRAFSGGESSPLPAVPLHYADFALWQQQSVTEATIVQQLAHWRSRLVEVEPVFAPPEPITGKQAGQYLTQFPESLGRSLTKFSRTQRVTSFVILLAALKLTLFHWKGQREILVVATVGNRTVPETERMLGCFINDVIVRSLISLTQTGGELLQTLQTTVNDAIDHKDVPLQRVIEQTKRDRPLNLMASLTMTPTVQGELLPGWATIDIQPTINQLNLQSEKSSELYTIGTEETTPLELYVGISNTIQLTANYSLVQFTAETVTRFFAVYQLILTTLVTDPTLTIATLLTKAPPPEKPV